MSARMVSRGGGGLYSLSGLKLLLQHRSTADSYYNEDDDEDDDDDDDKDDNVN